jgi:hypothetical protein
MKQYIGFSNDHSGSMGLLTSAAARDYNNNVAAIQSAALTNNIDTIVNVVQCGIRLSNGQTGVGRQIVNSNVHVLKPITNYIANGNSTPLLDSVGELIEMLKAVPDANDPDVSFLILVTTDGGENSSRKWSGQKLGQAIRELQATDRWTFVFRVPRNHTSHLTQYGIPEGNIQEWDQTTRGVEVSSAATTAAFNDFYSGRTRGIKGSSTFYSNIANVSAAEVKAALKDISAEVTLWPVLPNESGAEIRPFVEKRLGGPMLKGGAFYQLNKTESTVQDNKLIVIKEKSTGTIYYGPAARQMLGLPTVGNARVVPGAHGGWEVYIQSTSVNRKLVSGSYVLYWPMVGVAFTEGPSYQPKTASKTVATPVTSHQKAVANVQVTKAPTSKIRLIRKKDSAFVMEVDNMNEALAAIAKAKAGKKATLIIA